MKKNMGNRQTTMQLSTAMERLALNGQQIAEGLAKVEKHSDALNKRATADLQALKKRVNEGGKKEVVVMRQILTVAKEKLDKQNELLVQLTAGPLVYAVVAKINGNVVSTQKSRKPKPSDFKRGVRVRISRSSELSYQNQGIGQVLGSAGRGWVDVRFEDGYENQYKFRDLTLVTPPVDVISEGEKTIVVIHEGKQIEVKPPVGKKVNVGDTVKLSMQTLQIVDIAEPVTAGETSFVRRIIDPNTLEVDHDGAVRVVSSGRYSGKIEDGDKVIMLDTSFSIVLVNLGKEDYRFSFTKETGVTWDDIGGLAEAKRQMVEAIEMPYLHAKMYAHYSKKPVKGVLLYGPPGCGKTMLAKAAATSLAQIHKKDEASTGFLYVKGPEILDRFVGVSEATIRQIFQQARKHKQEHCYPAVVFIDEADAILGKRGTGISSDIERTIVPMFLAEMDGLEDSGAIVLLSTNRPDILDPAIVRDGRIDRKVKVDRPDEDSAVEIFKLHLRGVPFNNGYSIGDVATMGRDRLFSDRNRLYNITVTNGKGQETKSFTLGNLCNGAMIAGVVDQATSNAMHRDIKKGGTPKGATKKDVENAVDCVFRQNLDLNHEDELAEFIRNFRKNVVQIERASA